MNFLTALTTEEWSQRQQLISTICHGQEKIPYCDKYQALRQKKAIIVEASLITAVYPFSLRPTNKRVYLHQTKSFVYEMCAIDAIRICHTLHKHITIYSEDQLTRDEIIVDVSQNGIFNKTHNLYKPVCQMDNRDTLCYSYIHFFISRNNALKYLENCHQSSDEFVILDFKSAYEESKQLFTW